MKLDPITVHTILEAKINKYIPRLLTSLNKNESISNVFAADILEELIGDLMEDYEIQESRKITIMIWEALADSIHAKFPNMIVAKKAKSDGYASQIQLSMMEFEMKIYINVLLQDIAASDVRMAQKKVSFFTKLKNLFK